ncbi:MAG TPA: hypothetical protein VMH27_10635 [Puia sp.]|nr:hypothetical protein [Puia sp.]
MNFVTQYNAATREDVDIFLKAEAALGNGPKLNLAEALKILKGDDQHPGIVVDKTKKGNSYEDLLLSLVGFRLGEDIKNGKITDSKQVADFIRTNLK